MTKTDFKKFPIRHVVSAIALFFLVTGIYTIISLILAFLIAPYIQAQTQLIAVVVIFNFVIPTVAVVYAIHQKLPHSYLVGIISAYAYETFYVARGLYSLLIK